MFEFWLGIINPGFNWKIYCISSGWMRRQATIDDPLIALYQDDPTNYQMVKDYIRSQVTLKVRLLVPYHMGFTITTVDGYCIEYIKLFKIEAETYLEAAFDKTKMCQIDRKGLLWTRATYRLVRTNGTGWLKYNVTECTPSDARMLVDTILERFPGICPSALMKRKTALAMALHPRLGAGSSMCLDAELMAMVSKLVVD